MLLYVLRGCRRGCRPYAEALWMHRHAAAFDHGKTFPFEMDAKTVYTTQTRLQHSLSFLELARKSDDFRKVTPVAAAASVWEMQIIEKVRKSPTLHFILVSLSKVEVP